MNPTLTAVYVAGAIFAGVLIPWQTGYNMQLARALNSPFLSAIVIYVVGLTLLLALTVFMRVPLPTMASAATAPGFSWIAGGLLSMVYVLLLITLAPKLGAAPVVAFVVLGQIVCSLAIDHFGLLGFPVHPVSMMRLGGVALLLAGAALVKMS